MLKKPPFAGDVMDPNGLTTYSWNGDVSKGSARFMRERGTYSSVKSDPWPPLPGQKPPENPFSYNYSLERESQGFLFTYVDWAARNTGYSGYVSGSIGGSRSFPSRPSLDDALFKARAKVLDKLQDQSVNFAQAFAERRQTVSLLTKSINRLASAALAIKKGNFTHGLRLFGVTANAQSAARLKEEMLLGNRVIRDKYKPLSGRDIDTGSRRRDFLSSHWLEYSYGWRPLVQDIYGSAELLAKTFELERPLTVVGSSRDDVFQPRHQICNDGIFAEFSEPHTVNMRARVVVRYGLDNDLTALMSKTGLSNPANLAWELLPYSFVIDWIWPIGGYLKRLDATLGLSFHSGTESTSFRSSFNTRVQVSPGYVHGNATAQGGRYFEDISKWRSILTSFPRNSFPSPKNPFGVSRALSGLALLTQAFRR